MRKWITLLEDEAPSAILYHGTPIEHLIHILMGGMLVHREGIDDGHAGVSFTSEFEVAQSFAHEETHESSVLYGEFYSPEENNSLTGTVLSFSSADLGPLEQYHHAGEDAEKEWRTFGDVPASHIMDIYCVPDEARAWREDYLAARNDPSMMNYLQGRDEHTRNMLIGWLHSDEVLKTIDQIIARARPFPV